MLEFVMIMYQWALVFFDLIHLLLMSTWFTVLATYRFLFPVEKKSITGQLALVRMPHILP